MEPTTAGPSILLFLGAGVGSCAALLLALYNLVVLVSVLREPGDEKPSALSMAAWGVSFASLFFGPCGMFTALVGFFMGRFEQGRIYNEQSSIRSTRPCEMATLNALAVIAIMLLVTISVVADLL